MTKTQLRILGGVIILFNLWFIGNYQIEGVVILLMTLGVALLFEFVIVKNFASDRIDKKQNP